MENKILPFTYAAVCFLSLASASFFAGSACAQAVPAPQAPEARQDKISLDLKGLDIVDVLKMISGRSGMNIVVGKNVTGKVTIFLKDVNIWDAFEIILASNNLAYEKEGGIIKVMSDRDYELIYGEKFQDKKESLTRALKYAKAQDLSVTLNQIKSNIGRIIVNEPANTLIVLDTPQKISQIEKIISELDQPTETKVFELKYAQADKLSPKIQEAVSKGVGAIRIDERTNKIAITDFPDKIRELGKVIEAFDEKPSQVRIDAQIIEISPEKDEFKMGVDWDAWISKNLRLANSLPLGGVTKISLGLAAGGAAVGEKFDRRGIIDLLRTIGKTKILSSPTIMVLNNQEAKILVGTKEAYITSTVSQGGTGTEVTAQTVNFVDVGIKLFVTPMINKDGFVTMKIKPEVSSSKLTDLTSEGKITQVPIVTTSEAETMITLKDDTTIIIAGLKKDKKDRETKKIPILGDIPLLGIPFRSYSSSINKTELVIFLTPHIVTDAQSPAYSSLTRDEDVIKQLRNMELQGAKQLRPERLEHIPYEKEVREKILSLLRQNAPQGLKGGAVVRFCILSSGHLRGEPEITRATSEALGDYLARAVKSASPFKEFPQDLHKPQESFELEALYQ